MEEAAMMTEAWMTMEEAAQALERCSVGKKPAGQRAMILVRGCRRLLVSQRALAALIGVPPIYLSRATQVLKYAPEYVDRVASGAMPFNRALVEARKRKAAIRERW
jgi:hypothetical protein